MIFSKKKEAKNSIPEDVRRQVRIQALRSLIDEPIVIPPKDEAPKENELPRRAIQSVREAWGEQKPEPQGKHYEQFADMAEEAAAKADREGVVVKETREHDHRNWSPYSEGEVVFAKKEQARAFAREMRRAGKVAKVVKGKDGWVVYVYSKEPRSGGKIGGDLFKIPKSNIKTQPLKLGGVNGLTSFKEPQLADFDLSIPELNIPEPKLDFDIPLQSLDFEIKLPEISLDDSFLKAFGGERRGPKKKVRKK